MAQYTNVDRKDLRWGEQDLLLILAIYLLIPFSVVATATRFSPVLKRSSPPPSSSLHDGEGERAHAAPHPIVQLFQQAGNSSTLLVVLIVITSLVAPINEEFLFRLILLGYLRNREQRLREAIFRNNRLWEDWGWIHRLPVGIFSLLAISCLFAALHARDPRGSPSFEQLYHTVIFAMLGITLATILSVAWLVFARRCRLIDFGIVPSMLGRDLRLALVTVTIAFPHLTLLNFLLTTLFPTHVTDPIPLFIFGMLLGSLFLYTRRITASLFAHIGFNTASLVLLFLLHATG